jgi:hypothetical protein
MPEVEKVADEHGQGKHGDADATDDQERRLHR